MSKRKADRQLTDRDDLEAADEEQEDGTWKEASSDVLARRRIVRAPRRGGSATALAPEPPANVNAPKEEKQNEEKEQEQKEKAETDGKETKQEAEQSETKWPKYTFAESATASASTIGSTAWPTFSFSTASKTEEETSKGVEWPTFTSAATTTTTTTTATTDTSSTTPNFSFPSLSGLGSSWPTFSFSTEKKDDANQSAASSATPTWPTFNFSAPPTKAADDDKTEKKDNVWPSFESPLSNASSTGTEAGFKLIPSLGTLTGVGGDAKKTVELTTGGSGRWEVGSVPIGSQFGTSPSEVGTLASPKLAKVEKHTTGEEDEDQELEIRAKLFEFTKDDASEAGGFKWTERGVGQLKLKSAQGRARIVMRTENALRVILNAAIFPQMKVDKVNDKQIKFTCVNSIDGSTQKVGSFLAKVASAADGSTLYDTLAKLKTASANTPSTTSTSTSTVTKEKEQLEEQKEPTEKDRQTKTPERAEPEKNAD